MKVIKVKKIGTTDNPTYMIMMLAPSRKLEICIELLGVQNGEG